MCIMFKIIIHGMFCSDPCIFDICVVLFNIIVLCVPSNHVYDVLLCRIIIIV